MADINKILEEIDKSFDKSKDILKEGVKEYYKFAVKLEQDLANDQVFKNFLKNSTDEQLENKINELAKNIQLNPEQLLAVKDKDKIQNAAFDTILSSAIIKAIKQEQEKRKKAK